MPDFEDPPHCPCSCQIQELSAEHSAIQNDLRWLEQRDMELGAREQDVQEAGGKLQEHVSAGVADWVGVCE